MIVFEHENGVDFGEDAVDGMKGYEAEMAKPNGHEWDLATDVPPTYKLGGGAENDVSGVK